MIIETGSGLAFLGVCITGAVGVAKFLPGRTPPPPTNGHLTHEKAEEKFVGRTVCKVQHAGLEKAIEDIKTDNTDSHSRIEGKIDHVAEQLMSLLTVKG